MSNWREIGRIPYATWRAVLTSVGAPDGLTGVEAWQAAGEHSALCLAQLLIESGGGRSALARSNRNPLGLRPRDGGEGFVAFASFADAIRFWHGKIVDPAYAYADTVTLADYVHVYAPSSDGNNEQTYVRDVATYVGSWPREEGGEPNVPQTFTTTIPGLPGGPLKTTYPIRMNMIPAGHTRQRPGTKAHTPRRSVQHGTANDSNDDAMAEAQYFVNGAEGRQASVHYCTDDTQAVVVVPLDEVTWQAADGNGPGNMNGFSCEMMEATEIWTSPARRDRLIAITADLMGRTAARLGATVPEQHWTFNAGSPDRHDCPNKLRHTTINGRPAWDVYVQQWQAARVDELKRMQGGKPTYVKPHPPALKNGKPYPHIDDNGAVWLILSPARWKALETTERREYATVDADEVGPPVDKGDTISAVYSVTANDGNVWFVSRSGSRMLAEAFVPEMT